MPAYIADALDRRQCELDGAFAAWRQKPFDAEPHGGRVAGECKLDGFARQSLGLAREQRGGGECRLVPRAGPRTGRVARPPLLERPPATRPGSFGNSTSDMVIPLVQTAAHSRRQDRWMISYMAIL
jgi:hypothetical protein